MGDITDEPPQTPTLAISVYKGSRRLSPPRIPDARQLALQPGRSRLVQAWQAGRLYHQRSEQVVQRQAPPSQVSSTSLYATTLGCAAIALTLCWRAQPPFVLNLTASVPVGVYLRSAEALRVGDFAVVSTPPRYRDLAHRRGYLPRQRQLIKIAAARAGDAVCRMGSRVWIAGYSAVWTRRTDGTGRPLSAWQGCRVLKAPEVFVLGSHSHSFDSRYFGPIDRRLVMRRVIPILVSGTVNTIGK
jgi:conjugative transfer signal peptidase TraF